MKLWILIIATSHGQTIYGYKFIEKLNCEKTGKQIVSLIKKGTFFCKRKYFDTKNKID